MDFQVLYTKSALADLEELIGRSWQEYPGTTQRFGTALLNHVDLLKTFPRLGTPAEDYPGVRRMLHSPLYIYYRVLPETKRIDILHFWHVSRRPPRT